MKNQRIVIIDDDSSMIVLLEKLVTKAGYQPFSFTNPLKALEALDDPANHNVVMIITDMTMPRMDGMSFLKEVKKRLAVRDVPFLFLSALSDTAVLVNAIEAGAIDYFIKPIKNDLFIAKIRSMTEAFENRLRRARVLLSGQLEDKPVEEILAFCEHESLNGILTIQNPEGDEGMIQFVKGLPEKIEIRRENTMLQTDTEAFESLQSWGKGQFEVRLGSPDEG